MKFCSCFQSGKRTDDIGSKVNFPTAWKEMNTHLPLVPPLFIINFQIPCEFPTSLFKEITDGPGWSLVLYFRMTQVELMTWNEFSNLHQPHTHRDFSRKLPIAFVTLLLQLLELDFSPITVRMHQKQTSAAAPRHLHGRLDSKQQ